MADVTADELRSLCETTLTAAKLNRRSSHLLIAAPVLAEHTLRLLDVAEVAERFVAAYPGNQAGRLGNGAARRALDEFREALASVRAGHDTAERTQR